MTQSKIIELGRKIHELTRRGVEGERDAAVQILQKFIQKHGISIEDIEGEKKTFREFHFRSHLEERLICQIAANVVGRNTSRYRKRGKRKVVVYELTDAQYVEFELKYSTWRNLLIEEMEVFYEAFVCQNDIYPIGVAPKESHEMTKEEIKRVLRVQVMAENIKKANIHKQLKSHNNE